MDLRHLCTLCSEVFVYSFSFYAITVIIFSRFITSQGVYLWIPGKIEENKKTDSSRYGQSLFSYGAPARNSCQILLTSENTWEVNSNSSVITKSLEEYYCSGIIMAHRSILHKKKKSTVLINFRVSSTFKKSFLEGNHCRIYENIK